MKTRLFHFLAAVMTSAFILCGCTVKPAPSPEYTETPEQPETTENVDVPSAEYDAAKHVLTVTGTENYDLMVLPEEVAKSVLITVTDDDFTMNANPSVFRYYDMDLIEDIPELLDRTDKSVAFLKNYLKENGAYASDEGVISLPVEFNMLSTVRDGFKVRDDRIVINDYSRSIHREFYYLLAAMNTDSRGWEHLGYAWYVGTCIDPYNEVLFLLDNLDRDCPYYDLCKNAGVNFRHLTEKDVVTIYDAVSRVCFDRGLTHWGSTCESAPASSEQEFSRKRLENTDGGDNKMSAFMAASFIAWLERSYGTESVVDFCFARKSFDEAFGTDFDTAFDAWKAWIIETYPMD